MNDTLKDAGLALLGFAIYSALAGNRVRHAVLRDVRPAVTGGALDVRIIPQTPFDLGLGQVYRVRLTGSDFAADRLPFQVQPRPGIMARVRHMDMKLSNIVLHGVSVSSLSAEIPNVYVDGPAALFNGHLRVRSAGEGTCVAQLTEGGLEQFLAKKQSQLKGVKIRLANGVAHLTGTVMVVLAPAAVEATAKLAIAEGRYLNAVDAQVLLNGKPLSASLTEQLLKGLNPILDVERDLRLSDWLYVTGVEIGDGVVTVHARVHVPREQTTMGQGGH